MGDIYSRLVAEQGYAAWDSAVDIVMIVCPAGLPWDSLEATLRAAAP